MKSDSLYLYIFNADSAIKCSFIERSVLGLLDWWHSDPVSFVRKGRLPMRTLFVELSAWFNVWQLQQIAPTHHCLVQSL